MKYLPALFAVVSSSSLIDKIYDEFHLVTEKMEKLSDELNKAAIDFEHTILDVSDEVETAVDHAVHKMMDKKDLEA